MIYYKELTSETNISVSPYTVSFQNLTYCQISNISGTKSQNLCVSHLVLQLSLPYPLKSGVKLRMKM